jgi:peptidoglycan L-alanyl-D-glutamate endopeptidase CwlK
MSLVNEQWEFLQDVAALITFIAKKELTASGGELYRTEYQQAEYLRTGKSKTSNSMHLKRLAIDLNFFKDGVLLMDKKSLQPLGDWWEGLSEQNKWGGNFESFYDGGHFERHI